MFLCLSPPVVREERGTRRRPLTRAPLPSTWTVRRRTRCRKSWTPDAGAGYFNTSSTGRGMVLRTDHGSMLRISWTLHSQLNSIETTLTNQPLTPVGGLGIMHLQEPFAGGGLCHESGLCGSLRSPPKGHPLLSTSVHGLHFPYTPYLGLITGTGVSP